MEVVAVDQVGLNKSLFHRELGAHSRTALVQEEVLVLEETVEEIEQQALVVWIGQNFVDDWLQGLAEVKVEVFHQNVRLLARCIAQVDFAEDASFVALQSLQGAVFRQKLLVRLVLRRVDELSQVTDVLKEPQEAL